MMDLCASVEDLPSITTFGTHELAVGFDGTMDFK